MAVVAMSSVMVGPRSVGKFDGTAVPRLRSLDDGTRERSPSSSALSTGLTTRRTFDVLGTNGQIGAPPGYGLTDPTKLQPHGPIRIGADANYTSANGVRNGTGSPVDPYVLSDWSFDGNQYPKSHAMIWVEQTDRYLVIENVKITNLSGIGQYVGVEIGEYPNIVTTQHVTIRNIKVDSQRAYGIAVREGSSDIRVERNDIRLEANEDWVYGAVAMRGTHNVTFYGNYVNAYTNASYHTVGIHLSDFFVSEARDATGLLAERNTVVNATAGGIISESSWGTIVRRNLVFMNYPGPKSVAEDYPRGIETEKGSNKTVVAENVIHTFHWGIQVGSEGGSIYSNIIHDVDYAVYVLDNKSWNGTISSYDETIYNTSYWNVSNGAFRLPLNFTGKVVDLGPGVRLTDLTPVRILMDGPASRIEFGWAGQQLNLSVVVNGSLLFDTATAEEDQTLRVQWTGGIEDFNLTSFSAVNLSFRLQSRVVVGFEGSGFPSRLTYRLIRSDLNGPTGVLNAQTTPGGVLAFTIPAATSSNYALKADVTPPATTLLASGTSGDNGWYTSPVLVRLSATDDLTGVEAIHFRTDSGAWKVYAGPVLIDHDGAHTIEYYSTDIAGNLEAVRSFRLRLDATPPVLANITPSGTVTSQTVTFSWTGSDATSGVVGYAVSADEAPSESIGMNTSWILSLPDGDHVLEVRAVDAAGNTVRARTPIRVDTNVVSPSGSDLGIPLFVLLIGLGIVVAMFLTWRRRNSRALPRFPRKTQEWLRSRLRKIH